MNIFKRRSGIATVVNVPLHAVHGTCRRLLLIVATFNIDHNRYFVNVENMVNTEI